MRKYIIGCFLLISHPFLGQKFNPLMDPQEYIWMNIGVAGFTQGKAFGPKLGIDDHDTVYIAFGDSYYSNKASVMKFDGNQWAYVGSPGLSQGTFHSLSFCVSDSGQPFIAYIDINLGNRIVVKKYNGTNWVDVGSQPIIESKAYDVSINVNHLGVPYVVYSDSSCEYSLSVLKFDSLSWSYVGNPCFTGPYIYFPSLEFGINNDPYVVYKGSGVYVMKFDGADWTYVGYPPFQSTALFPSLCISSTGDLYLAACQETGWPGQGDPVVMRCNGSNWEIIGNFGPTTYGYARWTKISCSPTGNVFFSYWSWSPHKICVMQFDESNWISCGNCIIGPAEGSELVVNSTGSPIIGFTDETHGERATVMIFDSVQLGIDHHFESKALIYPNPASSYLLISIPLGLCDIYRIEIYNLYAEKIHYFITSEKISQVDISTFTPGIYTIKIVSPRFESTEKFIKM